MRPAGSATLPRLRARRFSAAQSWSWINTVTPGWVMTERQIRLHLDAKGEQALREGQCLPDLLQSEDIACMVLFLASDDAAMCSAQEFKVDAGWT